MSHHQIYEYGFAALTLGVSLWVAFGPLRHRLPRVLTRLAKYSAAAKLVGVSAVCAWGLHDNLHHHGSHAVRWALGTTAIITAAAAVWILMRKPSPPASAARSAGTPGSDRAAA